jgi:hypothetical protein
VASLKVWAARAVATRGQLLALSKRVDELEAEVQEARRLNRRLAEISDVVEEVLVPAANRDDERLRRLLDEYSKRL